MFEAFRSRPVTPFPNSMADNVKQQIITTALAKRGEDGQPEETYVQHLRIWEDDDGGSKSRLVILSCKSILPRYLANPDNLAQMIDVVEERFTKRNRIQVALCR